MVYAALESAVRSHRDDPLVAVVYDPILERLSAIDADLPHWADGYRPTPIRLRPRRIGERLESVHGGPLLAHHYTRYLGDLPAVGSSAARWTARTTSAASVWRSTTSRYTEDLQGRVSCSPRRPRSGDREVEQVVDEVKVGFPFNQALFDELAGNLAAYCEHDKGFRVGNGYCC